MAAAETVATWIGIFVGVATLLGVGKSAYNGHVRGVVKGLLKLEELSREVDAVYKRQEDLIDGFIALAYAQHNEDENVPTQKIKQEFDRDEGPRRFLQGDDDEQFLRGGDDD